MGSLHEVIKRTFKRIKWYYNSLSVCVCVCVCVCVERGGEGGRGRLLMFQIKFSNIYLFIYYAPNFEKVAGAYWFRVVFPSVRASVRQKPCMLGF